MLRAFALGVFVGVLEAFAWMVELIGRNAAGDPKYGLWPRNDGSDQALGPSGITAHRGIRRWRPRPDWKSTRLNAAAAASSRHRPEQRY